MEGKYKQIGLYAKVLKEKKTAMSILFWELDKINSCNRPAQNNMNYENGRWKDKRKR